MYGPILAIYKAFISIIKTLSYLLKINHQSHYQIHYEIHQMNLNLNHH